MSGDDAVLCEWEHGKEDEVEATVELYDRVEEVWSPACDECADGAPNSPSRPLQRAEF